MSTDQQVTQSLRAALAPHSSRLLVSCRHLAIPAAAAGRVLAWPEIDPDLPSGLPERIVGILVTRLSPDEVIWLEESLQKLGRTVLVVPVKKSQVADLLAAAFAPEAEREPVQPSVVQAVAIPTVVAPKQAAAVEPAAPTPQPPRKAAGLRMSRPRREAHRPVADPQIALRVLEARVGGSIFDALGRFVAEHFEPVDLRDPKIFAAEAHRYWDLMRRSRSKLSPTCFDRRALESHLESLRVRIREGKIVLPPAQL